MHRAILPILTAAILLAVAGCTTGNSSLPIVFDQGERETMQLIRERQKHELKRIELVNRIQDATDRAATNSSLKTTASQNLSKSEKQLLDAKEQVTAIQKELQNLQMPLTTPAGKATPDGNQDGKSANQAVAESAADTLRTRSDQALQSVKQGLADLQRARESIDKFQPLEETVSAVGSAALGVRTPEPDSRETRAKFKTGVRFLMIGLTALGIIMALLHKWSMAAGYALAGIAGCCLIVNEAFAQGAWISVLILVFSLPPLGGLMESDREKIARRIKNLRNNIRHEFTLLMRLAGSATADDEQELAMMQSRLTVLRLQ